MCCPSCVGPTGHPPKTYRIPVPDAAGGPPTVLVYRRVPAATASASDCHQGWKYEYDPDGQDRQAASGRGPSRTPGRTPRRAASRTTPTGDVVAPNRAHPARGPAPRRRCSRCGAERPPRTGGDDVSGRLLRLVCTAAMAAGTVLAPLPAAAVPEPGRRRRTPRRRAADGPSAAVPRGRGGHRDVQRHRGEAEEAARRGGPPGPRARPRPALAARQPGRGGPPGPAAVPGQHRHLPVRTPAARPRPAARARPGPCDRPVGAGAGRDGRPADRQREEGRRPGPRGAQGPRRPARPGRPAEEGPGRRTGTARRPSRNSSPPSPPNSSPRWPSWRRTGSTGHSSGSRRPAR